LVKAKQSFAQVWECAPRLSQVARTEVRTLLWSVVVRQAQSGNGQWPGQNQAAGPVSARPRVGLDVPIETKLHAPAARAGWVERPGLIQALASATARLVLVDAPAGFGKTTVVAQWRSSPDESRPFAWVSLDEGDNDPGRLWWHVVCALQRACPGFGGTDILASLRGQISAVTGLVLPLLVNELAALGSPVLLVLDDYQVIKERSCHEQVEFVLLHLPPAVQLVLITRSDPPLPLSRLRAAGAMTEIRARELRFTPEQAATLTHTVSGVQLSEPDLAVLMEQTEGWPAGVYLAALSLRGHPSPQAFVRQFSGNNRFIVDFLTQEVLSRQPRKIRQFLARTSVLGRFCAPLCETVSGAVNAAEVLDTLERENLFIVPLDDTRQWFRYHHLFAQTLRSLLMRTEPDIVPALHRNASAWHRQHGSMEEAISHAVDAGDLAQATGLIASDWFAYVDSGQVATVRRWMRSIGDDQIAVTPLAAHCAAWAAAFSGDRQTARRWLPVIDAAQQEGPLPDGMRSLKFSAALLRSVYGFDGFQAMRESAATAAELEDDPASPWYALARGALGFSLYMSGEPQAAIPPLREAANSQTSPTLTRLAALSTLSLIALDAGRPAEADEFAQAACGLAQRDDLSQATSASLAYVAAGAVHAARGRPEEARRQLEHVIQSRRRISGISPWPAMEATLRLAQVLLDTGDRAGAAELAKEAREVLSALPDGAQAQRARLEALEQQLASRRRAVPSAEALTDREAAVLRLLRSTMSLRDIGQEMFISPNTVKTHTQAIYRKLGVSTRREAVDRAKHMGLR
jgi:LuxR family maltose regulon positive regulatory protein